MWKEIEGFGGIYSASDEGFIRSNTCRRADGRVCKSVVLKTWKNNAGYDMVALRYNGKAKRCLVHKLIIETFKGICPKGFQVDHIDGNKSNNCLDNLRYVTRSTNLLLYYRVQGHYKGPSESQKLNLDRVHANLRKGVMMYTLDGEFLREFSSISDASRYVSGNRTGIMRACRDFRKYAYGHRWKYAQDVTTIENTVVNTVSE